MALSLPPPAWLRSSESADANSQAERGSNSNQPPNINLQHFEQTNSKLEVTSGRLQFKSAEAVKNKRKKNENTDHNGGAKLDCS